jgi:hypothetical protein
MSYPIRFHYKITVTATIKGKQFIFQTSRYLDLIHSVYGKESASHTYVFPALLSTGWGISRLTPLYLTNGLWYAPGS